NGDLVQRGRLAARVELLGVQDEDALARDIEALAQDPRRAQDLMTAPAITVTAGTPLRDAAHLMVERRLKRLPVVDEQGALVGMVSRADILRTLTEGFADEPLQLTEPEGPLPAHAHSVGEVMERTVPLVREDAGLAEVLAAVLSTRLNRAIVVDPEGRP